MALIDSIVSHWKLEEASGTAADEVSSYSLTRQVSPGASNTTGKFNNAYVCDRTNGGLWRAISGSSGLLSTSGKWTFAGWFYPTTLSSSSALAGHWTGGGPWTVVQSGSSAQLYVNSTLRLTHSVGFVVNTWQLVIAWQDIDTNTVGLAINGVESTASYSTVPASSTVDFQIGQIDRDKNTWGFRGTIDSCSWWQRALSSTERSNLYASGAGIDYPFSAGGTIHSRRTRSNRAGSRTAVA